MFIVSEHSKIIATFDAPPKTMLIGNESVFTSTG